MLALQPGIYFSGKGFSKKYSQGSTQATYKVNTYYLEFPINILYKHEFGDIKAFIHSGPYFGIGLFGKEIYSDNTHDPDVKETIKWGNTDDNRFRRMDFGWNFGGGVEFDKFIFSLNYALGLRNIYPYYPSIFKEKNRVFSISFGYYFFSLK